MLPAASTVLVTGGTGLIGSSIVRRLVAAGRSVRVLSRVEARTTHPQVAFCRGDLARLDDIRAALRGCDTIFHCAGEKTDRQRMLAVNVTATRELFGLATDSAVRFFCHVSSVGVIGKTALTIVDEDTSCNPTNHYEETKLGAEAIVARGLPGGTVAVLRPTNVFGVGNLYPRLDDSLLSAIRLFVTGNESSHLVYVEDVAAAALYALEAAAVGQVTTFNVSSDDDGGNTWREVRAAALAAVRPGKYRPATAAPRFVPHVLRRLRGDPANAGDIVYTSRKLRAAGFRFPFGLRAGLIDALGRPTDPLAGA